MLHFAATRRTRHGGGQSLVHPLFLSMSRRVGVHDLWQHPCPGSTPSKRLVSTSLRVGSRPHLVHGKFSLAGPMGAFVSHERRADVSHSRLPGHVTAERKARSSQAPVLSGRLQRSRFAGHQSNDNAAVGVDPHRLDSSRSAAALTGERGTLSASSSNSSMAWPRFLSFASSAAG